MSVHVTTRVCEGCGWVYPLSYNEARCRFCGTELKVRMCANCHELTELMPGRKICLSCYCKLYTNHRYWIWKYEADELFKEWTKKLKAAPFRGLTEAEWLEACRYFNGCALCNTSEVATRGYFIRYRDGGRYTAWNILPLCEYCATALIVQGNPFMRLDSKINRGAHVERGISYKLTHRAFDYLKERLPDDER